MLIETLNSKGLIVGDLVFHLLYGKDWRGILLGSKEVKKGLTSPCHLALIHMLPGTKYESYFKKNYLTKSAISDTLGYVSVKWVYPMIKKCE